MSRGTLQATFDHKPFNELQRLGLPSEVEARVRKEARGLQGGDVHGMVSQPVSHSGTRSQ